MNAYKGLHRVGTTPRQQGKHSTDDAISLMIRARDFDQPCILKFHNDCNPRNKMECGHFIERRFEATRYHPYNLNAECEKCNSSHVSGYRPDKGFPYGLAINAKWGAGTAEFLYNLAHPKKEIGKMAPEETWSVIELDQLRSAARIGYRAYEQVYRELRPRHFPNLTDSPNPR